MFSKNRLFPIAACLVSIFLLSACQSTKNSGIATEKNVVDEFKDEVQIVDAGVADSSSSAAEKAAAEKAAAEKAAAEKAAAEKAAAEKAAADKAAADKAAAEKAAAEKAAADKAAAEKAAADAMAEANAKTVKDDAPSRGVVNDMVPGGVPEYSVYFDFDQSSILPRFEEAVLAHAKYLRANSQLRVEIQGNCDERGSREYNISLGNRRALAVKKALELLGIDGSRIDVTSYGSERPRALGHDEADWQQNRRADFIY
jgi:peptidoglycan-associated lipoprotein